MNIQTKIIITFILTFLIPPAGLIVAIYFLLKREESESTTPYVIAIIVSAILSLISIILIIGIFSAISLVAGPIGDIQTMMHSTYEENFALCQSKTEPIG